jgi:uncharacterized protein with HEPN domain
MIFNTALTRLGQKMRMLPVRKSYPHAPWKEMAGMRDLLIHALVDYYLVRRTIKERLFQLKEDIHKIQKNIA